MRRMQIRFKMMLELKGVKIISLIRGNDECGDHIVITEFIIFCQ